EKAWQRQRKAFELARENMGVAAERSKARYDLKVHPTEYKRGEWVWLYSPRRYQGKSPKWTKNYSGPYLVTDIVGKVNVALQKTPQSPKQVVHVDKLKRCFSPGLKSWFGDEPANEHEIETSAGDVVLRPSRTEVERPDVVVPTPVPAPV